MKYYNKKPINVEGASTNQAAKNGIKDEQKPAATKFITEDGDILEGNEEFDDGGDYPADGGEQIFKEEDLLGPAD